MKRTNALWLLALFALLLASALPVAAQRKGKRGVTEQGLINRLQGCLAAKDAYCYIDLWPDLDTLTKLVMMYSDSSSADFREAMMIQDQPVKMMHADSVFKAMIKASFDSVIAGGDDLGVHWESIVPVRYELIKVRETRNKLYEKLAPTRFNGYIFFADMISRRSFGVMAGDIMQVNGEWYGGRLRGLYEAATRDEWEEAHYLAKKQKKDSAAKGAPKEAISTEQEQEINTNAPEVIADRKFYSGMFDNEIPVQLYVRSLKGGCPAGICSWEAIYKFGDQDDFIRLTVTRSDDGKWLMVEQPEAGSMELELKKGVFTGSWSSADGQTGYDVKFTEVPAAPKKIKRLDDIFAEMKGKKQ
jgi:hypothetical protein